VPCAAHPDRISEHVCAICKRGLCASCDAYDVDGKASCDACGRAEAERSRSLGSARIALVAVGYLAAIAIGVGVLHAQPMVGGLAAIAAFGLGRVILRTVHSPVVARRTGHRPTV
jgi:hypothetical protein